MSEPWRDPERYKTGPACVCLGCGNKCRKSPWGKWCYGCNVERIERINGRFAPFAAVVAALEDYAAVSGPQRTIE